MLSPLTFIYAARIGAGIIAFLLLFAAVGITDNFAAFRFWISMLLFVEALLFWKLNNRWISTACAIAGLIFNPSLGIMLPRHIWVIFDIAALAGILYATVWATNPYKKGTRFEQYVSTLFPEPEYALIDRTRDTSKFLDRRVESDSHPDFVFRDTGTGKAFAIECKWRAQWAIARSGDHGLWWNNYLREKYSAFAKKSGLPVFVAFGIGGTPQKPKEVYILPLEKLNYQFLTQNYIRSGMRPDQVITHIIQNDKASGG